MTDSKNPFTQPSAELLEELGVDPRVGLADSEVRERRSLLGSNLLAEAPPVPLWKKLLGQFRDLVVWILVAAAVIAGALGEWIDTAAILAIVLVNGIIGFLQEERAGRALAALRRISSPMARVIRNGIQQLVPASDLVPGDCLEIEAGDNIPADARLLTAFGLRVQESALTGESVPVDKSAERLLEENAPLGDRRNMVYLGTMVAAGKAGAVVVATGMYTELGQIAGLLQASAPEQTPLQRRLAELGRLLIIVCLTIVAIIFILQLVRGGGLLETLLISVSLAVAAVPEGLPAVVTLTLALGLHRMVRRNALIRKLPSVETLGSVTVICSDKTGTLTRNEMTVREIAVGGKSFRVTGAGYAPDGQFLAETGESGVSPTERDSPEVPASAVAPGPEPVRPSGDPDLTQLLTTAMLCNHASVLPPTGGQNAWEIVGDPTEGALVVLALKGGIEPPARGEGLLDEIPFDPERKAMSVIVRGSGTGPVLHCKGAPEVILSRCRSELRSGRIELLSSQRRQQIVQSAAGMASRAMRVLAFAFRENPEMKEGRFMESDLVFAGLTGMIDPPREEAREAVRRCRAAGIRPVMITGDHPDTALAVARELLIAERGDGEGGRERVVTGQELDSLSDVELGEIVGSVAVYARVSAEHKLRVVRAWKAAGQIVAMTGDGVNDAPAVKAADIGIAMGITGTDVTKEASDMVLTDDNFASIVNAVEEGRGIFDNIQKFIHFLLSCNAGEVLLMFFAALVGWPVPLVAIQILWINLVTDGLPALALAMERPERDIMTRRPRPPREAVITRERGLLILFHGTLIATVAALGFWSLHAGDADQLESARSAAFAITAFSQLFFVIGCRSRRFTMPELGPFTNPHLLAAILFSSLLQLAIMTVPVARNVFGATSHTLPEWLMIVLLSLVPVTLIEVLKILRALRTGRAMHRI